MSKGGNQMATATPIDKNQYDYLTNLSKTGSAGNQAWANSQLANSAYTPVAAPITATPSNSINKTPMNGSIGITGATPTVGPVLPGTARPNVSVTPVSAEPTKTQTAHIQNGTLQGPYINPSNGQVQQGANVVNGQIQYNKPTAQPIAAQPTTNASQGSYPGQLTTAQIAAEAQARIDKQRASLLNAVNGAKTGAKNTYDYTQGLQADSRTLEDAKTARTLSPFNGQTGYLQSMTNRDRQIADTASAKDYNNTIAGYDAQVASFDTLAPEQQQSIIDDLTRQERDYGLQVGTLTGQFNGQNTMQQNQNNFNNGIAQSQLDLQKQQQAYNQDPNNPNNQGQVLQNQGQTIQNQLAQFQLDNYPAESKAQATLLEQQVKSGALSNEAAAYNLQQLKDLNSPTNQAAKLDLQMKQIDAKNYSQESQLKLQQLQKQIADIGVVHKTPQTVAQIEYDQQQVIKIKAEIEKLNNPTPKPATVDPKESTDAYTNYSNQIANSTYTKEQKLAFAASVKDELTSSDYAKLVAGIQ